MRFKTRPAAGVTTGLVVAGPPTATPPTTPPGDIRYSCAPNGSSTIKKLGSAVSSDPACRTSAPASIDLALTAKPT